MEGEHEIRSFHWTGAIGCKSDATGGRCRRGCRRASLKVFGTEDRATCCGIKPQQGSTAQSASSAPSPLLRRPAHPPPSGQPPEIPFSAILRFLYLLNKPAALLSFKREDGREAFETLPGHPVFVKRLIRYKVIPATDISCEVLDKMADVLLGWFLQNRGAKAAARS
jgi:hypothetical protein